MENGESGGVGEAKTEGKGRRRDRGTERETRAEQTCLRISNHRLALDSMHFAKRSNERAYARDGESSLAATQRGALFGRITY